MSLPLLPVKDLPELPLKEFGAALAARLRAGGRALAYFAVP